MNLDWPLYTLFLNYEADIIEICCELRVMCERRQGEINYLLLFHVIINILRFLVA